MRVLLRCVCPACPLLSGRRWRIDRDRGRKHRFLLECFLAQGFLIHFLGGLRAKLRFFLNGLGQGVKRPSQYNRYPVADLDYPAFALPVLQDQIARTLRLFRLRFRCGYRHFHSLEFDHLGNTIFPSDRHELGIGESRPGDNSAKHDY